MNTRAEIRLVDEEKFKSPVQAGWDRVASILNERGCAVLEKLLTRKECDKLAARYASDDGFRSRVIMSRHGFGKGEYKYFAYPLPEPIASLRNALYPPLAKIANDWNARMGIATRYPSEHQEFLAQCHAAGQQRPTPLLLQYGPGDYNCLHQDLYGELAFPLQATILLSASGRDFAGGEFVITEQRPRMQSRAEVGAAGPGRCRDLCGAPSAGTGHARRLSRESSPRRQPPAQRPPPHRRHPLSRREMNAGRDGGRFLG